MSRSALVILGFGFLALTVGLFVPALVDAPDDQDRPAFELDVNGSTTIDEAVTVELDAVNETAGSANVTVTDVESLSSSTITNLSVGETKSAQPGDDSVDVTLQSVVDSDTAAFQVAFAWTYGWNDGAAIIVDEFDTILVIVGFIIMVGGVGAVLKP